MAKSPSSSSRRAKAPRRKTVTCQLVWRGITCTVVHTTNYIFPGQSHLELTVQSAPRVPLPITRTGYLSHFVPEDAVTAAGDAVAFFTEWLDREAASKAWVMAELARRQGDLFTVPN
jgi:hypothetical protein